MASPPWTPTTPQSSPVQPRPAPPRPAPPRPAPLRIIEETARQVDAYLEGRSRAFTVPMDLRLATPFSRTTVERLDSLLPCGVTGAYAEPATALGRPRAARAVGTALGANPLCVVLPCHRVVGSGGRPTGYAGGVTAKRFLLALESGGTPAASLRTGGQFHGVVGARAGRGGGAALLQARQPWGQGLIRRPGRCLSAAAPRPSSPWTTRRRRPPG
ncbi:methylated-DNA--[protein]-cysteine S-methyltransferase [Streptomyces sp. NPDC001443]